MSMSQAEAQDGAHLMTMMHLKPGTPVLPSAGFSSGKAGGGGGRPIPFFLSFFLLKPADLPRLGISGSCRLSRILVFSTAFLPSP